MHKRIAVAIGGITLVGLLAGCKGRVVETVVVTQIATAPAPETSLPALSPEPTPVLRDAITICLSAEPDTPLVFSTTDAAREILSAATRNSWEVDRAYSYESPLLESFPLLENGDLVLTEQPDGKRTIEATFRFKAGIRWSDGEPFTTLDVVQTFYAIRYRVTGDSYEIPVAIVIVDDQTVTLLSQAGVGDQRYPFRPEEEWLLPIGSLYHDGGTVFFPQHSFQSPIAQSILTEEPFILELPNPTLGPYEFAEWITGDSVRLQAVGDWWGGAASVPNLVYRFIPDLNQRLAALLSGECDYLAGGIITLEQLPFIQEVASKGLLKYQVVQSPVWDQITFNTNPPPDAPNGGIPFFADARVRQAIAYGTDRQRMADEVFLGEGRVMHSTLPEEHWAYLPEAGDSYPYDPEKARQLLFDAGWRDLDGDGLLEAYTDLTGEHECRQGKWTVPAGTFFVVDYAYPQGETVREQIAGIFAENMAEIGITVNIVAVPPLEFYPGGLRGEGYSLPSPEGIAAPGAQSGTGGLLERRAFQIANSSWAVEPDPDAWFQYGGVNIYQTPSGEYADGATLLEQNPLLLQGRAIYEKDFVSGRVDPALLPPGYTLAVSDQIPSPADDFTGGNYGGWCDQGASKLLFDGQRELDWSKRAPYYQEFQRIFVAQLPSLPLFQRIEIDAYAPTLCGPGRGPLQYASWNVETWYFTQDGECN